MYAVSNTKNRCSLTVVFAKFSVCGKCCIYILLEKKSKLRIICTTASALRKVRWNIENCFNLTKLGNASHISYFSIMITINNF